MCKTCEELLRQKNAAINRAVDKAALGAAGMSIGAQANTIEQEIARMGEYISNASVTYNPHMTIGAPSGEGKSYAFGYTDFTGVKRVFIVPIDVAEEAAHSMLQEIAHVKAKTDREILKADLRGVIGKIELGINLEAIREELSDLAAEG